MPNARAYWAVSPDDYFLSTDPDYTNAFTKLINDANNNVFTEAVQLAGNKTYPISANLPSIVNLQMATNGPFPATLSFSPGLNGLWFTGTNQKVILDNVKLLSGDGYSGSAAFVQSGGNDVGLLVDNNFHGQYTFKKVWCQGFNSHGFSLGGASGYFGWLEQCTAWTCGGAGFNLVGGQTAGVSKAVACNAESCGSWGWNVRAAGWTLDRCQGAYSSATVGYWAFPAVVGYAAGATQITFVSVMKFPAWQVNQPNMQLTGPGIANGTYVTAQTSAPITTITGTYLSTNQITLSSATGVAVNMSVTDSTNGPRIPGGSVITAIAGNVITLSNSGISNAISGDSLVIGGNTYTLSQPTSAANGTLGVQGTASGLAQQWMDPGATWSSAGTTIQFSSTTVSEGLIGRPVDAMYGGNGMYAGSLTSVITAVNTANNTATLYPAARTGGGGTGVTIGNAGAMWFVQYGIRAVDFYSEDSYKPAQTSTGWNKGANDIAFVQINNVGAEYNITAWTDLGWRSPFGQYLHGQVQDGKSQLDIMAANNYKNFQVGRFTSSGQGDTSTATRFVANSIATTANSVFTNGLGPGIASDSGQAPIGSQIAQGTGAPTGISAAVGDWYLRADATAAATAGSRLYICSTAGAPAEGGIALTQTLTTTGPIAALPIGHIGTYLPIGTVVTLTSGGNTQTFTVAYPGQNPTGAIGAGYATNVPVASATPNFAYPAGTLLTWNTAVWTATAT